MGNIFLPPSKIVRESAAAKQRPVTDPARSSSAGMETAWLLHFLGAITPQRGFTKDVGKLLFSFSRSGVERKEATSGKRD
jgi:hypothetical protein